MHWKKAICGEMQIIGEKQDSGVSWKFGVGGQTSRAAKQVFVTSASQWTKHSLPMGNLFSFFKLYVDAE